MHYKNFFFFIYNELFIIFLNEINVFDIIQHIYISYWI